MTDPEIRLYDEPVSQHEMSTLHLQLVCFLVMALFFYFDRRHYKYPPQAYKYKNMAWITPKNIDLIQEISPLLRGLPIV